MGRVGPLGRLSRGVDHAIRWRLGMIGVDQAGAAGDPGGVEAFWTSSRVLDPAAVSARPVPPRGLSRGAARLLDLEAESSGSGDHPGSRRVHGRVALHPDPAAPVVLLLHGYAAPSPIYEDWQTRLLLRRGLSAARIELPYHMRRRIPGRAAGFGFFSRDPAHTRAALRQATEDAAAVVAWLRREVTETVGVLGFSLGGLVGCLLGAHVALDSLVAVTPPCDLPELTLVRSPARLRRELGLVPGGGGPWGADAGSARAALDLALAPVVPRLLSPRTPGSLITLVAAELDLIVGDAPVRDLAAAWGADCWSYGHGHVTVMTARGLTGRIHERMRLDLGAPRAGTAGAIAG